MATFVPTRALERERRTRENSGASGVQPVKFTVLEAVAVMPLLLTKSPENVRGPHTGGDVISDRGGAAGASTKRVAVMSVGRLSRIVSVPPSARNWVWAVIGPGSLPS